MTNSTYACIPTADGITQMLTPLSIEHEPSVLAGVKAANDWLDSLDHISQETNFCFSFENLANQLLKQADQNHYAFKMGYALRLEQRLLGSPFLIHGRA